MRNWVKWLGHIGILITLLILITLINKFWKKKIKQYLYKAVSKCDGGCINSWSVLIFRKETQQSGHRSTALLSLITLGLVCLYSRAFPGYMKHRGAYIIPAAFPISIYIFVLNKSFGLELVKSKTMH